MHIDAFDVWLRSTGGSQVVLAHIYPVVGSVPQAAPLATTVMTVGPGPGFCRATFAAPVPVNGDVLIAVDLSAPTVVLPTLRHGVAGAVFTRPPAAANWRHAASAATAYRIHCLEGRTYLVPELGNAGVPALGASYEVTLAAAQPSTGAFLLTGLSNTSWGGLPLPLPLPNAPGCDLLAAPEASCLAFTDAAGQARCAVTLPNAASCVGLRLFHQWAVVDPRSPLGLVVSDAGKAFVGW
jgi:hypothetical protein